MTIMSQCMICKNLLDGKPANCKAFPNGIPDEILHNKFDHRNAFLGDKGIQFDPEPGQESPFKK